MHIAQILADFCLAQILNSGIACAAIIPGHAGGLLNKPADQIPASLCINCLRAEAHPIPARPAAGVGRAMGSHLACGRPHDQDELTFDHLGRQDRGIGRIEPIAVAADPLLRRFNGLGRQAMRGQCRTSGPFFNADDDIAAVQVVIVIRKRADRPEYLRAGGVWIPRRLKLHPLRLYAAAMEEIVEIDGKNRTHGL